MRHWKQREVLGWPWIGHALFIVIPSCSVKVHASALRKKAKRNIKMVSVKGQSINNDKLRDTKKKKNYQDSVNSFAHIWINLGNILRFQDDEAVLKRVNGLSIFPRMIL
jgi:hypothetical protein